MAGPDYDDNSGMYPDEDTVQEEIDRMTDFNADWTRNMHEDDWGY